MGTTKLSETWTSGATSHTARDTNKATTVMTAFSADLKLSHIVLASPLPIPVSVRELQAKVLPVAKAVWTEKHTATTRC